MHHFVGFRRHFFFFSNFCKIFFQKFLKKFWKTNEMMHIVNKNSNVSCLQKFRFTKSKAFNHWFYANLTMCLTGWLGNRGFWVGKKGEDCKHDYWITLFRKVPFFLSRGVYKQWYWCILFTMSPSSNNIGSYNIPLTTWYFLPYVWGDKWNPYIQNEGTL